MSKRLALLAARGHTLSHTAQLLALKVLTSNRYHRLRLGDPCVLTRAELAAQLWPGRVTHWRKRTVGAALHELADAGLIGLDVTRRAPGARGEPGVEQQFTVRRVALTDTAPAADPHAQPGLPLGPLAVRMKPKPKAAKPKPTAPKPTPKRTAPPLKPAARAPGPDRRATPPTRVWKPAFRRRG